MKRLLVLLLVASPVFAQKTLSDGIKDLSTQLSASITKEQKKRVAVLPFKELDGQTTVLGTYLAEELLSHLVNSGLKIVERGLLDKILSEQKLQQTGAIDPATAKQVGKLAGVDAITFSTRTVNDGEAEWSTAANTNPLAFPLGREFEPAGHFSRRAVPVEQYLPW